MDNFKELMRMSRKIDSLRDEFNVQVWKQFNAEAQAEIFDKFPEAREVTFWVEHQAVRCADVAFGHLCVTRTNHDGKYASIFDWLEGYVDTNNCSSEGLCDIYRPGLAYWNRTFFLLRRDK